LFSGAADDIGGSSTLKDGREVAVDYSSPLRNMIPVFQRMFPSLGPYELSFSFAEGIDPIERRYSKARPLVSFDSLENQNFTSEGYLLIAPITVYEKLSSSMILLPDKEGFLLKQSNSKGKWTSVKRRWFILKDGHLFYFKASSSKLPYKICIYLPAESLFCLTILQVSRGLFTERRSVVGILGSRSSGTRRQSRTQGRVLDLPYAFSRESVLSVVLRFDDDAHTQGLLHLPLTRAYEGFTSKHGDEYLLSGPEADIKAWQEVSSVRPLEYVAALLRDHAQVLRHRCINGQTKRVFGVELKDLLARYPGNSVPPFFRDLLASLEAALDTEGLFRVSGSMAHLEWVKAQLDEGVHQDLTTLDPHTVRRAFRIIRCSLSLSLSRVRVR
jgi:hypothetical protein